MWEQKQALGIRPGDVITNERGYRILNDRVFSGKAVDNRAGCTAAIEVMKNLKDVAHDADVYCCGSVLEEMGVKGAGPAAESMQFVLMFALEQQERRWMGITDAIIWEKDRQLCYMTGTIQVVWEILFQQNCQML